MTQLLTLTTTQKLSSLDTEPVGRALLAGVHVVAKGQDELQHLFEALAALHLLAGLQHGLHLGPDLGQPDVELFLVVQSAQPLFVVGDPENVFCVDLAYLSNSGK